MGQFVTLLSKMEKKNIIYVTNCIDRIHFTWRNCANSTPSFYLCGREIVLGSTILVLSHMIRDLD